MYLVTGVSGKVGRAVATHLLAAGLPVRVLVRSAQKGEEWGRRGCQVAVADMLDTTAFSEALRGIEGAFVVIPPIFDPSDGFPEARAIYDSLTTALKGARPDKAVILSTIGAQAPSPNLLNQLGLMESTLRDIGLPVAFLRAAWFMENFSWDVAGARSEGVINSFLQPLDRAVPMVATDDIGAVGAAMLQENWTGARIVELSGPSDVTPNDVASAFADALGRPVEAKPVPRAAWQEIFLSAGMKNPTPRIQMLDGFNAGWIRFEGDPIEQRRGETGIGTVVAGLVNR